jgi:hypothetical protein
VTDMTNVRVLATKIKLAHARCSSVSKFDTYNTNYTYLPMNQKEQVGGKPSNTPYDLLETCHKHQGWVVGLTQAHYPEMNKPHQLSNVIYL